VQPVIGSSTDIPYTVIPVVPSSDYPEFTIMRIGSSQITALVKGVTVIRLARSSERPFCGPNNIRKQWAGRKEAADDLG
jgi:hypothetical protein